MNEHNKTSSDSNITQYPTRIVKKFLWFPRKVDGQLKWLQTVYIIQAHKVFGYDGDMWFDVRFVSEDTYKYYLDTGHVLVTQKKINQVWNDYYS